MRIIIAGAGAVGTHLARLLVQENHDIILMDEDRERLSNIKDNVELLAQVGNCNSLKDLSDANVKNADLFIAVTPEESKNITACMLASNLGARKTLARIDNYEYLLPKNIEFFQKLGIDSMIYPEMMAAREIESALKNPWTRAWWELSNGSIILSGAKIRENAPISSRYIHELSRENKKFHIVAIKRDNYTIIPTGKDQVLPEDILYFTTLRKNLADLPEIMGKTSFETKNIIIMGGSRIALQTVNYLPDNINVKIVEKDRERAEFLVEKTPSNVTVFLGDGRDTELLVNEGINEADAFLALTGNSEANILACIAAKQHGVKKTIAEVENLDYISLAEKFDIGTIINKKLIAASKIYELLLKADASNIKNLAFANANVGEIIAHPNSKVTRKLIKNLNLPSDITFGALIRNGEPMLIDGETLVEPYDQVVVFFLNRSMKSIEDFFS
ncbi:MAG: Trk system potassium transporter TrkA [Dysgonamonadaceae bacterium]|jgi:trk system potassium uptake protein TrkA|nr:Trk system potassium transporter TrkA [Dysgonamonadaceae bacterium]MDD3355839.1 Trk system potassium transporter TrkA [Dysgonamonadaceae bacterium]MDD3727231.1 Trk system potassium transporter TrkA [Dysgonamonadaceae bacterium]MDD4246237.1 Trk system potassium transporter TrkA [Dysgonamonadaceae bacterium]MDD4605606.1 Trk system potassium transporter TrkA [Dysgonamonadaceae bacterium]